MTALTQLKNVAESKPTLQKKGKWNLGERSQINRTNGYQMLPRIQFLKTSHISHVSYPIFI